MCHRCVTRNPWSLCMRHSDPAVLGIQSTSLAVIASLRPCHSYAAAPAAAFPLLSPPAVTNGVIFRQMFDDASSTYTYLLADPNTLEAVLIDPVLEQVRKTRQNTWQLQGYHTHGFVPPDWMTGCMLMPGDSYACDSFVSAM